MAMRPLPTLRKETRTPHISAVPPPVKAIAAKVPIPTAITRSARNHNIRTTIGESYSDLRSSEVANAEQNGAAVTT